MDAFADGYKAETLIHILHSLLKTPTVHAISIPWTQAVTKRELNMAKDLGPIADLVTNISRQVGHTGYNNNRISVSLIGYAGLSTLGNNCKDILDMLDTRRKKAKLCTFAQLSPWERVYSNLSSRIRPSGCCGKYVSKINLHAYFISIMLEYRI